MTADALTACREYDHWAREVARLTREITACRCPQESAELDVMYGEGKSCFNAAKYDTVPETPGIPQDGERRIYLSEIAERVADCPECSRLCGLIAARREARQKWGQAKRAVRTVGRKAGAA